MKPLSIPTLAALVAAALAPMALAQETKQAPGEEKIKIVLVPSSGTNTGPGRISGTNTGGGGSSSEYDYSGWCSSIATLISKASFKAAQLEKAGYSDSALKTFRDALYAAKKLIKETTDHDNLNYSLTYKAVVRGLELIDQVKPEGKIEILDPPYSDMAYALMSSYFDFVEKTARELDAFWLKERYEYESRGCFKKHAQCKFEAQIEAKFERYAAEQIEWVITNFLCQGTQTATMKSCRFTIHPSGRGWYTKWDTKVFLRTVSLVANNVSKDLMILPFASKWFCLAGDFKKFSEDANSAALGNDYMPNLKEIKTLTGIIEELLGHSPPIWDGLYFQLLRKIGCR
jgi:hypothetical protein